MFKSLCGSKKPSIAQEGNPIAGFPEQIAGHRSPWQRPAKENTNGLIRESPPRGLDVSPISQGGLNALARQRNKRPRKCLGFEPPAEVFARKIIDLKHSVALRTRNRRFIRRLESPKACIIAAESFLIPNQEATSDEP
jgi:hypothetical protein